MARKAGKDRGITQRKGREGWWVRVYEEGRQTWRKCDSKSQARTLYGRLKADAREEKLFPKPKKTKSLLLKDYFVTWLKNQPARGKKVTTIKTYESRLRKHALPAFGTSQLSAISRPRIKGWAAGLLEKGLDFDTALNALLTLSAVLTEAVEDGLITHNPALRSGKLLKRPATIEESELAIFTPPGPDARVDAGTLVAARLAGVGTVYKAGGAQAVAAAAHGTETVRRARKIVGPGSPWIVAAKRALAGVIDPGLPAGPSESIILADDTVHGGLAALRTPSDLDPIRSAYAHRASRLTAALRALGLPTVAPEGGFCLMTDVRHHLAPGESSDTLALRLLEEAHGATVAGEAFGAPGFLRMSFACSDLALDLAIARLGGFFGRHQGA